MTEDEARAWIAQLDRTRKADNAMTNKTVKELAEGLNLAADRLDGVFDKGLTASLRLRQAATTLTQQAAEIEALRDALESIRAAKRQLPIGALTGGGPTDG